MKREMPAADFDWLLIFAFPNGGSTAVAKLLLTAAGTVALNEHAEGQWLVPEMCQPRVRWAPESALDFADIRRRWLAALQVRIEQPAPFEEHPLVIEKSPPNMCRYDNIVSMLGGMKTYTVAVSRDPYATCARWHASVGPGHIERNWGWPGDRPEDEDAYFRALGEIWLQRAKYLARIREQAVHWMRYEDFAAQPSASVSELARKIPRLRTANPEASITVKAYPLQRVRNMNAEQISTLSQRQRKAIHAALAHEPDLVAHFGYQVTPP